MNAKVDTFLNSATKWQLELTKLRQIALDCELEEAFKWGFPCYMFQNANVISINTFKTSCTLLFFKGALLKDPQAILEKPGQNSQSARVIRFTTVDDIVQLESSLKAYIQAAIEIEKAGLKVVTEPSNALVMPEELEEKFEKNEALKSAFESLTPGRRRAYLMHFLDGKQAKTRVARIEKWTPQILEGKGLNDCTCGLSQKMPGCDGSHKRLKA